MFILSIYVISVKDGPILKLINVANDCLFKYFYDHPEIYRLTRKYVGDQAMIVPHSTVPKDEERNM